jgi:hypothetical protein
MATTKSIPERIWMELAKEGNQNNGKTPLLSKLFQSLNGVCNREIDKCDWNKWTTWEFTLFAQGWIELRDPVLTGDKTQVVCLNYRDEIPKNCATLVRNPKYPKGKQFLDNPKEFLMAAHFAGKLRSSSFPLQLQFTAPTLEDIFWRVSLPTRLVKAFLSFCQQTKLNRKTKLNLIEV